MSASGSGRPPLRVAIIAGESSGDQLGGRLMAALKTACETPPVFFGVGGPAMDSQGLKSLFPLSQTALMGVMAVATRLPHLVRLVWRTVDKVVAFRPDVLVIIDSPEFTHAVAKRVRRRLARLPVIDYVSPTVWAWRPWRARAMRSYVDHVAAIFPFEPEVHARLGGPPCTYVGHPAIELAERQDGLPAKSEGRPVLALLPGSRRSEVRALLPIFRDVTAELATRGIVFEPALPAVSHLAEEIAAAVSGWPVPVRIVTDEAEKHAVFGVATAALAASGTVTLELALARVPMVVAYRVDPFISLMKKAFYRPHSVAMANLMLKTPAFPEFVGARISSTALADALAPLFDGTSVERTAQLAALAEISRVAAAGGEAPSTRVARLVLDAAGRSGDYLRMEIGT